MGDLLKQLQKNAEIAKKDNIELKEERDKLTEEKEGLESSIKDIHNNQTKH